MSEQEIRFMEYFEGTMLPNKRRITMDMLHECERILGRNLQIAGCNACMHRVAVDMHNLYNRMKPVYEEWLNKVNEVVIEEVIEPEISFTAFSEGEQLDTLKMEKP